ncbi:MAG TPA: transglutaminase family protein [Casimicrobiaceae bacterium]|nr:transglutaminase family protein [Casimicrobiaceae bacterium]
MQRLAITHLTEYRYASPVTLGVHQLMLRPREGHDVRIESSKLEISPAAVVRWHRDVFDNSVAVATFSEGSDRLSIASEVTIEHYEEAPLDFVVADYAVNYPFSYAAEDRVDLMPYRQLAYPDDQAALRDWMGGLGLGAVQTYALLDRLNRAIAGELAYTRREEPGVQPPSRTLLDRRGSCRDYATLFIEACRCLGLAGRFVSGYLHAPATVAGSAATHAWAEIYLPGPGWKGFDPTSGEITGANHIAVAVARHPETVPPVAGAFTGQTGIAPAMRVDVQVRRL